MPFINIYLPVGCSPDVKRRISLSIHESLMEVFKIPESDYFQVIHSLNPEDLIFPMCYLGIVHSPDLVYIHITCGPGRTNEMKKLLYMMIAEKIKIRTSISSNDIIIILNETSLENWSFGQGKAQMIR
jgi:phenylpyruvate tautomerase PptA (4-oxalocrotonate tautomerase family)